MSIITSKRKQIINVVASSINAKYVGSIFCTYLHNYLNVTEMLKFLHYSCMIVKTLVII